MPYKMKSGFKLKEGFKFKDRTIKPKIHKKYKRGRTRIVNLKDFLS